MGTLSFKKTFQYGHGRLGRYCGHCSYGGQHGHGGQHEHCGQQIHGDYVEDFWFLEVASRHLWMDKVDLVGRIEMVDMVDNMYMVDNINVVDSIDMVNIHKSVSYLKLLVDTSG